ncbi:unnamed protein product, partial [Rotaria sordida]
MLNSTLSSTEDSIKENIRSAPQLAHHASYSRHLFSKHERVYSNEKSRIIIHANIGSPKNNHYLNENKFIDSNRDLHSISTILTARHRQDKANNSDVISNSPEEIQSATHSFNVNSGSQRHRPFSISFIINDSSLVVNQNKTAKKKELWSNTKDFHKDSKRKKKKKRRCPGGYPCSCLCLLACLLIAFLLCIAIAAILLAILFKPNTTTSTSTTDVTTTTVTSSTSTTQTTIVSTSSASSSTTIMTSVSSSTTTIVTSSTSTITTSSVSTIAMTTTISLTTTSCTTPSSTILYYNSAPTSYTQQTYNYIASSTGTAVLEFGFHSIGSNKDGYLDDVSIVDTNASNSEMLMNGDFENGTLVGWQMICGSNCVSLSGTLSMASCNA